MNPAPPQLRLKPKTFSSLIGNWSLCSYSTKNAKGDLVTLREGQTGRLTYDQDGNVQVKIERDPEALEINKLSPQIASITYSGYYEVDHEHCEIKHIITKSNLSNRVGTTLLMNFRIIDDKLFIEGQGLDGLVQLEWVRV